jgi:ribonuclease HII
VVCVNSHTPTAPVGLRDSKQLTPAARQQLVQPLKDWAQDQALGWASAGEVDALGITEALRQAGLRALAQLVQPPEVVILDGQHDWLDPAGEPACRVVTQVKADQACASVAAASVLAKVARDNLMTEMAANYPDYSWQANKGYGSPAHLQALRIHGLSPQHRASWKRSWQ